MKKQALKTVIGLGFPLLVAVVLLQSFFRGEQPADDQARHFSVGDAQKVERAYLKWKAAYQKSGGDRNFVLTVGWAKALSESFTTAVGEARFDLVDGTAFVEVVRLPQDGDFDVWLVDNRPGEGRSVLPESGDALVHLGRLQPQGGGAQLRAVLDRKVLTGFHIDMVVVTQDGKDPTQGGLLFGSPSLFQRMYLGATEILVSGYSAERPPVPTMNAGVGDTFFKTLFAASTPARGLSFNALVKVGEDLFVNEAFNGNGRTCASCHRLDNNLTIDAEFIATLPPDDALFVAEFNDSLNFALNGGRFFENPALMRTFGLIVENVDGMEDLTSKFAMRGVPHVLAQRTSLVPGVGDGTTTPPDQRTGWSGDGAPGSGTLREFAIGAVIQHFPKTLSRSVAEGDFRMPTEFELDALEAFQLSTGRQEELDLSTMTFLDANVVTGETVFLGTGKCNSCHVNAGANFIAAPDQNRNFDTGVEDFPHAADALGEPRPRDGGFGRDLNSQGGFGNGTFNTAPLVEAGDTPPFFHNNVADDLEPAVDFYNSDAFNNSPSGIFLGGISMTELEVQQVTAFLYILNVLENIRVTVDLLEKARATLDFDESQKFLLIATAENHDSIESLEDGNENFPVHPDILDDLDVIAGYIDQARAAPHRSDKIYFINLALDILETLPGQMVEIESDEVAIVGDWESGLQHAEEPGSDRGLVFTAHVEHNGSISLNSVSYGGQPMTLVREKRRTSSGFTAYVAAFILDEAGVAAATNNAFTVSWSTTPTRQPGYASVFLTGVDQADLIGASAGSSVVGFHTVSTSSLPTQDGDLTILAATSGNPGSYRVKNGFTEAIELNMFSSDGVAGFRAATGESVTPKVTQFGANRQVLIGFVVQVGGGAASKQADRVAEAPQVGAEVPSGFELFQNFPNPFNPSTEIRFEIRDARHVIVRVFDSAGREVRRLTDGLYVAGIHSVRWDGTAANGGVVSSGVYFYQIEAGDFVQTKKMVFVK